MLNPTGDRATPRPLLVFDGDCALCRNWVARVRKLDRDGRIDAVPLRDSEATRRTGRDTTALSKAVHFVRPDGGVTEGATALRDVLRYLRGGRLVAWAFALPGAMWVADRVYAGVAARRATNLPAE